MTKARELLKPLKKKGDAAVLARLLRDAAKSKSPPVVIVDDKDVIHLISNNGVKKQTKTAEFKQMKIGPDPYQSALIVTKADSADPEVAYLPNKKLTWIRNQVAASNSKSFTSNEATVSCTQETWDDAAFNWGPPENQPCPEDKAIGPSATTAKTSGTPGAAGPAAPAKDGGAGSPNDKAAAKPAGNAAAPPAANAGAAPAGSGEGAAGDGGAGGNAGASGDGAGASAGSGVGGGGGMGGQKPNLGNIGKIDGAGFDGGGGGGGAGGAGGGGGGGAPDKTFQGLGSNIKGASNSASNQAPASSASASAPPSPIKSAAGPGGPPPGPGASNTAMNPKSAPAFFGGSGGGGPSAGPTGTPTASTSKMDQQPIETKSAQTPKKSSFLLADGRGIPELPPFRPKHPFPESAGSAGQMGEDEGPAKFAAPSRQSIPPPQPTQTTARQSVKDTPADEHETRSTNLLPPAQELIGGKIPAKTPSNPKREFYFNFLVTLAMAGALIYLFNFSDLPYLLRFKNRPNKFER